MAQPRQFINVIPLRGSDVCVVATTRQYTKELAQKQILSNLQDKADSALLDKMYTRELVVDEDGVIRIVDGNGEVLPLDTVKL